MGQGYMAWATWISLDLPNTPALHDMSKKLLVDELAHFHIKLHQAPLTQTEGETTKSRGREYPGKQTTSAISSDRAIIQTVPFHKNGIIQPNLAREHYPPATHSRNRALQAVGSNSQQAQTCGKRSAMGKI